MKSSKSPGRVLAPPPGGRGQLPAHVQLGPRPVAPTARGNRGTVLAPPPASRSSASGGHRQFPAHAQLAPRPVAPVGNRGRVLALPPASRSSGPGNQPQGYQPQGYQPQGYQPQGYQPQGYQPQGYQPQGTSGYWPQNPLPGQPNAANLTNEQILRHIMEDSRKKQQFYEKLLQQYQRQQQQQSRRTEAALRNMTRQNARPLGGARRAFGAMEDVMNESGGWDPNALVGETPDFTAFDPGSMVGNLDPGSMVGNFDLGSAMSGYDMNVFAGADMGGLVSSMDLTSMMDFCSFMF